MARATLFRNRCRRVCAAFFFAVRSEFTSRGFSLPADVAGYRCDAETRLLFDVPLTTDAGSVASHPLLLPRSHQAI
jgi:hypothetical protein